MVMSPIWTNIMGTGLQWGLGQGGQTQPENWMQQGQPSGGLYSAVTDAYEEAAQEFLRILVEQEGYDAIPGAKIKFVNGKYWVVKDLVAHSAGEWLNMEGFDYSTIQTGIQNMGGTMPSETPTGLPEMPDLMGMTDYERAYLDYLLGGQAQEQAQWEQEMQRQAWLDQMQWAQWMTELQRSPLYWPSYWNITRGGQPMVSPSISLGTPWWEQWQGGQPVTQPPTQLPPEQIPPTQERLPWGGDTRIQTRPYTGTDPYMLATGWHEAYVPPEQLGPREHPGQAYFIPGSYLQGILSPEIWQQYYSPEAGYPQ